MPESTIEDVIHLLEARGIASSETIVGCSEADMMRVREYLGNDIPAAYAEFLRRMGRGAGKFFAGTDMFYPTNLDLTRAAREIVAEEDPHLRLPNDILVIGMHQGYEFMFVRKGEGDDPPVYYYLEGSGAVVKRNDRFSDYLMEAARDDW